jgi:hypothetical protein
MDDHCFSTCQLHGKQISKNTRHKRQVWATKAGCRAGPVNIETLASIQIREGL